MSSRSRKSWVLVSIPVVKFSVVTTSGVAVGSTIVTAVVGVTFGVVGLPQPLTARLASMVVLQLRKVRLLIWCIFFSLIIFNTTTD